MQRYQNNADVVDDVSRILVDMSQLRMRLPGEFDKREDDFSLYSFMASLKLFAEKIIDSKESEHEAEFSVQEVDQSLDQGAFVGDNGLFGAYVGDNPDSAIDVSVEPVFQTLRNALTKPEDEGEGEKLPTIEELMASFVGVPSRAPTPPPKDVKRLELARNGMVSPFGIRPKSPSTVYGSVTEISSERRSMDSSASLRKSKGFRRFFTPMKQTISEDRPQTQSTSSISEETTIPASPIIRASLVRRSSHRLSVSFKKLPMWNEDPTVDETESLNSNAVFGVSLQKSMQVIKGTSKTHHAGNGGSSRRDFPLCMQKCAFFIKNEGVQAPDIFAEPGDSYRVQKLKEAFSSPPTYGEELKWNNFSVYDAADLILLFLSQLPKPLISDTIAKQWISLSRQLTLSGSDSTRLDQCIDFWEEALGGLRGPSRTLFKLLLNLWADISQAAEKNDMTAERLAGVLIKPLMHTSSTKHETDFMLSLAFLIRRRAEYIDLIKKDQSEVKRISRAAW